MPDQITQATETHLLPARHGRGNDSLDHFKQHFGFAKDVVDFRKCCWVSDSRTLDGKLELLHERWNQV